MKIWFHPAAEIEHLDQVAYYESRQSGLGAGYLAEIDRLLASIAERPHQYPQISGAELRRAHSRRFPIAILFREHGDQLQILAVAHKRRRPSYWVTRL